MRCYTNEFLANLGKFLNIRRNILGQNKIPLFDQNYKKEGISSY